MERIKLGFIINPIAGGHDNGNLAALILKTVDSRRYEIRIAIASCPGEASDLARTMVSDLFTCIVAAGGDGTVQEVARELIHTGCALGILPIGSGNGLGRELGISLNPQQALAELTQSVPVSIDYGTVNGQPFFSTCGAGFDAKVGKLYARSGRRGFWSYLSSMFQELFKYQPKRYALITPSGNERFRAFIIAFANCGQYGYDAYIAPEANLQDGLIDIAIIEPLPMYRLPVFIHALFNRRVGITRNTRVIRTSEAVLKRKKKGPIQIDGEWKKAKRVLKIRVIPAGLRVMVGPGSRYWPKGSVLQAPIR